MSKQNKQGNMSSTQGEVLQYEPAPPDNWGADLLDWDINLLLLDWEPPLPEDWDISSLDYNTTNLLQGGELLSDPKHGKG